MYSPKRPVGHGVLAQHHASIMNLLKKQRVEFSINILRDDQVNTPKVQQLLKLVKNRKVKLSRSNYEEKLDKELLPYVNVQEFPRMEQAFWDYCTNSDYTHAAYIGLRNRDCLLTSKTAILRGESLFYGELSDCLDVMHASQTGDPTPYHILIQQIDSGKTHRHINGHVRGVAASMCLCSLRALHCLLAFGTHVAYCSYLLLY